MPRVLVVRYCPLIVILVCLQTIKSDSSSYEKLVSRWKRDPNDDAYRTEERDQERQGIRHMVDSGILLFSDLSLHVPYDKSNAEMTTSASPYWWDDRQNGVLHKRSRRSSEDEDVQEEFRSTRRLRTRERRRKTSSGPHTSRRRVALRLAREEDSVPDDIQKIRVVQMKKSIDSQSNTSRNGVAVASVVVRHKTARPQRQRSDSSFDRRQRLEKQVLQGSDDINSTSSDDTTLSKHEVNRSPEIIIDNEKISREITPPTPSTRRLTRYKNNRTNLRRKSNLRASDRKGGSSGVEESTENHTTESHSKPSYNLRSASGRRSSSSSKNRYSRTRAHVKRLKDRSEEPLDQSVKNVSISEDPMDSTNSIEKEIVTSKSSKPGRSDAASKAKIRKKVGRIRIVSHSKQSIIEDNRPSINKTSTSQSEKLVESKEGDAKNNIKFSIDDEKESEKVDHSSSEDVSTEIPSNGFGNETSGKSQSIKSRYQNRLRFRPSLFRGKQEEQFIEETTSSTINYEISTKAHSNNIIRVKHLLGQGSNERRPSNRSTSNRLRLRGSHSREIFFKPLIDDDNHKLNDNYSTILENDPKPSSLNVSNNKHYVEKKNRGPSFVLPSLSSNNRKLSTDTISLSATTEAVSTSTQATAIKRKGLVFPRKLYGVIKTPREEIRNVSRHENNSKNNSESTQEFTGSEKQGTGVIGGISRTKARDKLSLRRKSNTQVLTRPFIYNTNRREDSVSILPFTFPTRNPNRTTSSTTSDGKLPNSSDQQTQAYSKTLSKTGPEQLASNDIGDLTVTTENFESLSTLNTVTSTVIGESQTWDNIEIESTTSRARIPNSLYYWLDKTQNKSHTISHNAPDDHTDRSSSTIPWTSTPFHDVTTSDVTTRQKTTPETGTDETLKALGIPNVSQDTTIKQRSFNPLYKSALYQSTIEVEKMAENIARLRAQLHSDDVISLSQAQDPTTEIPAETNACGHRGSGVQICNDKAFVLNKTATSLSSETSIQKTTDLSLNGADGRANKKDGKQVSASDTLGYLAPVIDKTDRTPITTQNPIGINVESESTTLLDHSTPLMETEKHSLFSASVEKNLKGSLPTRKPPSDFHGRKPLKLSNRDQTRSGRSSLFDIAQYRHKSQRNNIRSLVELLKGSISRNKVALLPSTSTASPSDESTQSWRITSLITPISTLSSNNMKDSQTTVKNTLLKNCESSGSSACTDIVPENDDKQRYGAYLGKSDLKFVETENETTRPQIDYQNVNKIWQDKVRKTNITAEVLSSEQKQKTKETSIEKEWNFVLKNKNIETSTVGSSDSVDESKANSSIIDLPTTSETTVKSDRNSTYQVITTTEKDTLTLEETSTSSVQNISHSTKIEKESTTAETPTTLTFTIKENTEYGRSETTTASWMKTATLANSIVESIYADSTEKFTDVNSIVEAVFELTSQPSSFTPKSTTTMKTSSNDTGGGNISRSDDIGSQTSSNSSAVPDIRQSFSINNVSHNAKSVTLDSTRQNVNTTPNNLIQKNANKLMPKDEETSFKKNLTENKEVITNRDFDLEKKQFESPDLTNNRPDLATFNISQFIEQSTTSTTSVTGSLSMETVSTITAAAINDITDNYQVSFDVINRTNSPDSVPVINLSTDSPNNRRTTDNDLAEINKEQVDTKSNSSSNNQPVFAAISHKLSRANIPNASTNNVKLEEDAAYSESGKASLFDSHSLLAYSTVTPRYRDPDSLFKGKTYQSRAATTGNSTNHTIVAAFVLYLISVIYL